MKRCLLLVVALATIPSTFALPTGEFPIAARPTGFAPHDRRNVMIAANETAALAVWEDFRVDPNQPPRIWATRVGVQSGNVLDPTGIEIAALPASEGSALRAVGTDGNDFLIAWTEGTRLKFARVTGGGEVTNRTDPGIQAEKVSITWIGSLYAVFYTFVSTPSLPPGSVEVIMLFRDTTVALRPPGGSVILSPGIGDMAASVNTHNAVLAWSDAADGTVHSASIPIPQLQSGQITRPPAVSPVVPTPPVPPLVSVATDGTNIFAAWYDKTNPLLYRVRLFDGDGFPLTAITDVEPGPLDPALAPRPGVVWDGGQYVVTFQSVDGALQAVRFAANGSRIDATPLSVTPNVIGFSTSSTTAVGEVALAWLTPQSSGAQVGADFLNNGTPRFGPGHLSLSTSFVDRSDAVVVWAGDHYLAAWRDEANVTRTVIGRISPDGVPLDGDGVDVSVGIAASAPVLASNGRTGVVAWQDVAGVSASFVDELGHVSRRMFDFPGGKPSVNWNGSQYLVAWRSSQGHLLGLRMNGAGQLIDQNPVDTGVLLAGDPVVGWTGNSYVVTDLEATPQPAFPAQLAIYARFLSASLTPTSSAIQASDGGVTGTVGTPFVADGPQGALIVWTRTANGATTIRAARAVNGILLDQPPGLLVGEGTSPTAYGSGGGWGIVDGPFLRTVSASGAVSARIAEFPFVPVGSRSLFVLGGPSPLVVYRRPPAGTEQMMQVVARYLFTNRRERAVKH